MQKHINPALVISLVALFVALGGSSYAALKLPRNSVGNKQIKASAVTSPKVKDRSLLAKDFRAGQLPQGATGATGPRGPSDGYVGNRQVSPLKPVAGVATVAAASPELPAGNYVALGRANIVGFGVASAISCSLGDDAVQSLSTSPGTVIPLALSSGFRLSAPGRIQMFCQVGSGSGVAVAQSSITATRVENLTIETTSTD